MGVLRVLGGEHTDANVLRDLAESFPDEPEVADFVADELWRRAAALSEAAGPTADLTLAQLAWGTALLLAVFVMQFLQTVVAMQILHAIRGSR